MVTISPQAERLAANLCGMFSTYSFNELGFDCETEPERSKGDLLYEILKVI